MSVQAIVTEAALEFAASKVPHSFGGVLMGYYTTDPWLLPSNTFFKIDGSIRGKPAEYIYYHWFNAK